jgi:hypothetical protein
VILARVIAERLRRSPTPQKYLTTNTFIPERRGEVQKQEEATCSECPETNRE